MAAKKAHGQLRRSQVLTTFGTGSLVDLPRHSVLVAGLDHWKGKGDAVVEDRLTEKLERLLELTGLRLYAPPIDGDDPSAPPTGLTAWQFPAWFITQDVQADGG